MNIDLTMGVCGAARAILAIVSECDGIESSWHNDHYRARIALAPWYNGRERGLSFVLTDGDYIAKHAMTVVVYEHRNSDNICLLHWVGNPYYLNPPTLADIPEGKYKDKWDVDVSFSYDEHMKAALHIIGLFENFCQSWPPVPAKGE